MSKRTMRAVHVLFAVYVLVMLYLLFRPNRNGYDFSYGYWELFRSNYNFKPFATIKAYAYVLANDVEAYRHAAVVNLFGNIGLFIPLGIFLPVIFEECRMPFITLLVSALAIVSVELIQLVSLTGCCDIDDLILNMIGVLIGHMLFRIVSIAKG